MNVFMNIICILIGYIFLSTSIHKVLHLKEHFQIIESYKILPQFLNKSFGFLDIMLEFIIVAGLLTGNLHIYCLILSILLLILYSSAISINLIRGKREIECGCGGVLGNHRISFVLVIRNFGFIIINLVLIYYISTKLNFDSLNIKQLVEIHLAILTLLISIIAYRSCFIVSRQLKRIQIERR